MSLKYVDIFLTVVGHVDNLRNWPLRRRSLGMFLLLWVGHEEYWIIFDDFRWVSI